MKRSLRASAGWKISRAAPGHTVSMLLVLAGIVLVTLMLTTCENALLAEIRKASRSLEVLLPRIALLVDGEEIIDGGASDAFIDAEQGKPFDVEFTIRNDGKGDLVLRDEKPVEITGADADLLSVLTPPGNLTIGTGATTTFTIRMQLDSSGPKSAQIRVFSNDPEHNPFQFTVSNETFPRIQVRFGGTIVADGDSIEIDRAEYLEGSTSGILTISNLGTANLELYDWSLVSSDDYTIIGPGEVDLAPAQSTTLEIVFAGSLPGWRETHLILESSDTERSPQTFTLAALCFLPVQETFMAISEHALARTEEGNVWTWGSNSFGQLGLGYADSNPHPHPVQIDGLNGVVAVETTYQASFALLSDGSVQSWGRRYLGALGDGGGHSGFYRATPAPVSDLIDIVAISGGRWHGLALRNDGTVWAWGNNQDGQLGTGEFGGTHSTPIQVNGGFERAVRIAAGDNHSAIVDTNGQVWTWGSNTSGQLGIGNRDNKSSPVMVTGLSTEIIDIASGGFHTVALDTGGKLHAWGSSSYGQLGANIVGGDRLTPIAVADTALTQAKAVQAGQYHTIAIGVDDSFWGWGLASSGEIGTQMTHAIAPKQCTILYAEIRDIAAGNEVTLVLTVDGRVLSFGKGSHGQKGDGTVSNRFVPAHVGTGFRDVVKIVHGQGHTLALKSDGTVWTWGMNDYGQLGRGWGANRSLPGQVPGITGIVDIAAGRSHSLVLGGDGSIWGWGRNSSRELGNPGHTWGSYPSPIEAAIGIAGTVVALGSSHSSSFAITSTGDLWAWGSNYWGSLGDDLGSENDPPQNHSPTPILVPGLSSVAIQQVTGGSGHTLALDTEGNVWSWGLNNHGQLGDGSLTRRTTPQKVPGLSGVTAIAAGQRHSFAVTGGGLVAWGEGTHYVLGLGDEERRLSPVTVQGITDVVGVASAFAHSIAVKSDGTTWIWGVMSMAGGVGIDYAPEAPAAIPGLGTTIGVEAGLNTSLVITTEGTVWTAGRNLEGQLGAGSWEDWRALMGLVVPLRLW
ncbi:MAG: choice-of-anchor D domain-containing protein [Spirochaetaceae bacterium]|nr:MAG: choice-of-anchor D domain-containing protein [Spirochaetaceae bacterium]